MIDLPTFLCALAMVETGVNDHAIGKHGERSRYQITYRAWHEQSPIGFILYASDPKVSSESAARIITKIRVQLPPARRDNVIWLAVAWHSGLSRAKTGKFKSLLHAQESLEYATRVRNTYNDLLKKHEIKQSKNSQKFCWGRIHNNPTHNNKTLPKKARTVHRRRGT